jgi:hypothetical protein
MGVRTHHQQTNSSSLLSLHSPFLAFLLVFVSGIWLGALIPNEHFRQLPLIRKDSPKYADQMLRASFITQASEGQAIIPGAATDWVDKNNNRGGRKSKHNNNNNNNNNKISSSSSSNGDDDDDDDDDINDGCACAKKPNSASELLSSFGESGLGQLASPSISKEDALAKIDALQRARTHLAKEKANLEGERNALNKVVKEAQRASELCMKELKKKKGH